MKPSVIDAVVVVLLCTGLLVALEKYCVVSSMQSIMDAPSQRQARSQDARWMDVDFSLAPNSKIWCNRLQNNRSYYQSHHKTLHYYFSLLILREVCCTFLIKKSTCSGSISGKQPWPKLAT